MSGAPAFYRPELDVLRFFAFLAVFAHHSLPHTLESYLELGLSPATASWLVAAVTSGAFGVDVFFVLSAYLITELLTREHEQRGRIEVVSFYARRILRIWPLYFTFLAAIVLFEPSVLPHHRFPLAHQLSFAVFLANWSCAFLDYPSSSAALLWSISIEEQFYVVWPLVVSWARGRRLLGFAVALLVVAAATRVWLVSRGAVHPAIWCNTFARLDPIA